MRFDRAALAMALVIATALPLGAGCGGDDGPADTVFLVTVSLQGPLVGARRVAVDLTNNGQTDSMLFPEEGPSAEDIVFPATLAITMDPARMGSASFSVTVQDASGAALASGSTPPTEFEPGGRNIVSVSIPVGGMHALTVTRSGPRTGTVTSQPGGITCGATCTAQFAAGTNVTLTAVAEAGATFGWSGECSGSGPCTVRMDAARDVTVTFAANTPGMQALTLDVSGMGALSSNPTGVTCANCTTETVMFPTGTVVTLQPTPGMGSLYTLWRGACTGSGICTVTMDAPKTVRVHFGTPGMVYVPEGPFIMGCNPTLDSECQPDEGTQPRTVTISKPFEIDRLEVTAGDMKICRSGNACQDSCSNCDRAGQGAGELELTDAAIYVMYAGALEFCTLHGKRLPSEAEWEKAARGTDGRKYPWGNSPAPDCTSNPNYDCQARGGAGLFPQAASIYGVMDMAGSVDEWVSDWFERDYYLSAPLLDPMGPNSGTNGRGTRVGPRASARGQFSTDYVYTQHGARCAKSIP